MKKLVLAATAAVMLFASVPVSFAATSYGTIETTAYPYLKSQPYSGKGEIYGSVKKGTQLQVLEKTNKYYVKVNYNGKVGYISTLYIKYINQGTSTSAPAPAPVVQAAWEKTADKVIALAKSLQGKVQYGYGKNDTKNLLFDCSSFTKYVFQQAAGINMKWGARAQFTQFKEVSKSQLRKGDLVFTSLNSTMDRSDKVMRIAHVGIYIGNGQFISNISPTSDVQIRSINSGYYGSHYVTAARVIN